MGICMGGVSHCEPRLDNVRYEGMNKGSIKGRVSLQRFGYLVDKDAIGKGRKGVYRIQDVDSIVVISRITNNLRSHHMQTNLVRSLNSVFGVCTYRAELCLHHVPPPSYPVAWHGSR